MTNQNRSKNIGNGYLSSSVIRKKPNNGHWFTFSVFIGLAVIVITIALFGYIFAHTHITLGQYDKEIKFIRNKIETVENFAKASIEIPIHSIQQNFHLPPIDMRIDHEKHIVERDQVKKSILNYPIQEPQILPTESIESNTIKMFDHLLHLVRIREQPVPEVITDHPSTIVDPFAASVVITSTSSSSTNSNQKPEVAHKLSCPYGELMTFWKPPTKKDLEYVTPFTYVGPKEKYVTFEPDFGGWNNIRMQMELVLVFAAATGRTLVLPPDQPMYLLYHGTGHQKFHNFADFFPFEVIKQRVPVITMEEYMIREAITGNLKYYPPGNRTIFDGTSLYHRKLMWAYLRNVSSCPTWKSMYEFVVIPFAPGMNSSLLPNASYYENRRNQFAADRKPRFYDDYWQHQKYVHFISDQNQELRLLEHFYTFIHFEDEAMGRLYKRFVRDYVHYIDTIFCKAALIVNKLNEESNGSFSTFHIRRGEFQYKEVKISAKEMMVNVGHLLPLKQVLYIATDEKNKSFFDDFSPRFPVIKYLDDYMDYADLRDINPNFLGMIDQVVCTKGQYFVGTWFSTFSGYITRMRGYFGYHDYTVYYGDKKRRDRFHHFELPKFPFYMREWNISWYQIDEE